MSKGYPESNIDNLGYTVFLLLGLTPNVLTKNNNIWFKPGPILRACFNFNARRDKKSHARYSVGDVTFIPKFQLQALKFGNGYYLVISLHTL